MRTLLLCAVLAAVSAVALWLVRGREPGGSPVRSGDAPTGDLARAEPLEVARVEPEPTGGSSRRVEARHGLEIRIEDGCGRAVDVRVTAPDGFLVEHAVRGAWCIDVPGPGLYSIELREDLSHCTQHVEQEITAHEPWKLVVLEARHRTPIPVFALTPDGQPLFEQLRFSAAHVPNRPRALVTKESAGAPGEVLDEAAVSSSASSRIVGVLRPEPGGIGVLELLDPPPLYVSLALGDVLLDVVEVSGEEERIVLRADSERVAAMLCEVRFRLVSSEGPLFATRGYGLRGRGVSGTLIKTVTDAEGRGACRGVPPGKYELCVQVDGYAFLAEELELAPGETLEVGDLLLEPGILIQGQVVDENGAAVDARVSFRRPADPEQELGTHSVLGSPSEHPGWFAVGDLPQGPILCRVEGAEWAVNPRWITAAGAVLEGLVVEAVRGTEVTLVAAGGAASRIRWTIVGERSDHVWSTTVDTTEVTVRLLPGRYVVKREAPDGRSSSRSFDVAREPRRVEL